MTVSTSGARHLFFRVAPRSRLPDAILGVLRDEVVLAGWMRGSGVLGDVELRVADPRTGGETQPRRIAGPLHAIVLEGSVGLASGDVSCGLRVVLSRETDSGLETIAGELVSARVEALEVLVTAFDELTATRQLDSSGAWLLDIAGAAAPQNQAPRTEVSAGGPVDESLSAAAQMSSAATTAPMRSQGGFAEVVRASELEMQRPPATSAAPVAAAAPTFPTKPSPALATGNPMPSRIVRRAPDDEEQAIPEPGDIVEHFAFGRCEVVKTDGDRLHVRLPKDQRLKEIALEMLRVSPLPPVEGQTTRHFKLARKL